MSKFCPSCGKQLNDTAMFCEHCGTKLNTESTVSEEVSQVYMPATEEKTYENDDDNSAAAMLRSRSYEEKPKEKKPVRRKIIAVLAFLVVCAGGALAYLLLKEPEKPLMPNREVVSSKAEKTESEPEVLTTSDEDSKADDSSEPETEDNEWEIKAEIEAPEKELDVTTETVNDHEIKKFSTGIKDSYYDFVNYYKEQYGSNASYSQFKTEDVYTRQSQGKNYTGVKDNYNININANTRDGESVVLAKSSFSTYTAYFDGASSFYMEIHDEEGESVSTFQTACYDHLKNFMDEDLAEFLVYGQGKVYYGEEDNKNLEYEMIFSTQDIKMKANRNVEIDKRHGFKAAFEIGFELMTDEESQTPYFDGSSPEVYNNSSIKISDFIPVLSDPSQTDCGSSHEFMKNVMSNFTIPGKKFIDTKLDSMNVTEMVSEDDGSKTKNAFKFRVSSGVSGMKYEDAPFVDFNFEAVKDDKSNYSECNGEIYGNLKNSNRTDKNVESIISFLKAIYPNIAGANIPADKAVESLRKNQPFEIDVKIGAAWSSNVPAHLVISNEEGTCFTLTFGIEQQSVNKEDDSKDESSSIGLEEDMPQEASSKTDNSSKADSLKTDSSSKAESSSRSDSSSKKEEKSSAKENE